MTPERITEAWLAAFGRCPDSVTVHGEEVRVEGLAIYPTGEQWGIGRLVSIPPEAPGDPVEEGAVPHGVYHTPEDALFALLMLASVADEARREIQGKPSRWDELNHGPF